MNTNSMKRHKKCFAGTVLAFLILIASFAACEVSSGGNGFATDGDIVHLTYTDQDIILGLVPGVSTGRIVASDTTINSTQSDVWNGDADTNLIWATSSDTIDIVSTSVLDDIGSTGALAVRVEGLDNSFDSLIETINLDGITPVTTTSSFSRINRIIVDGVGVYGGSNIGTIDASFTINSNLQARIDPGFGLSQKSHYTLPDNHVGIIRNVVASVESLRVVNFNLNFRTNDVLPPSSPQTTFVPLSLFNVTGTVDFPLISGQPLNPRSDIWFSASQQNQTATASLVIDFYIVDLDSLPSVETFVQICNQIAILCG